MEFSLENLRKLLDESKGLHLLPEAKRGGVIETVMASDETEQYRVFSVLVKASEQVNEAEQKYNQMVSEALDHYTVNVQQIEKDTLKNLRNKKEVEIQKKEESQMDQLLNELNQI